MSGQEILAWVGRRLYLGYLILGIQAPNSWVMLDPGCASEVTEILDDYLGQSNGEGD